MSEAFSGLINRWREAVDSQENPAYSRTLVVAAFDAADAVLKASEGPKEERIAVASALEELALRAHAHHRESQQADAEEQRIVEERREEVRRLTRKIA
jgi:hypothetical protein